MLLPGRRPRLHTDLMSHVIAWGFYSCVLLLLSLLLSSSTSATTNASPPAQVPTRTPRTPTPTPKPIMLTDRVPDPKQQGVQYFPATGHTLRGAFLDYWTRYGGLAQFGYPLTEEFYEQVGSEGKQYLVQYFERNRFEHHPENRGTQYEVLLGALGRDFRSQDPPATPVANTRYFPETGHNLSGPFRTYWETHGALFVHGYPITEAKMERSTDGKEYLVQWFERSRFELHPENKPPYDVLLGLLGRQLSEKKGYPYGWYPEYGHAADFSWVSGRMQFYSPPQCESADCGCAIFKYEARGTTLQLSMIYLIGDFKLHDVFTNRKPIVALGRLPRVGEIYQSCLLERQIPGYIVDRLQANPGSDGVWANLSPKP